MGSFDTVGEVPKGWMLSDARILGPSVMQGNDYLLGLLLLHNGRGRSHLLPLCLLADSWTALGDRKLSSILS